MPTMLTEVYDAFLSCGADDSKARKAAEALSDYRQEIREMRSEINALRWMVGYIVLVVTGIAIQTLF